MKIEKILKYIGYTIIGVIIIFLYGLFFVWEDPTWTNAPVTWYWVFARFLSLIFVSNASFSIWACIILYLVNDWYEDRRQIKTSLNPRKTVEQLEQEKRDLKRMLNVARSQLSQYPQKMMELMAIINLFREKADPSLLAEIEELVNLESYLGK